MDLEVWTIVVAGGSGTRFGAPKQYVALAGDTVLGHSVTVAAENSSGVVVVVPVADTDHVRDELSSRGTDRPVVVTGGGATRAASVRAGLAAVPAAATHVLVHDAARPAASGDLYRRVVSALRRGADGVIPVVDVADPLRRRGGGTVDRRDILAVQTPQGFAAGVLRAAHESGGDATDDATLVEALGVRIETVPGERHNMKVTEPLDATMIGAILEFGVSGDTPGRS